MAEAPPLGPLLDWLWADAHRTPPEIEAKARLLFLDTLGCMIAGLRKPEPGALVAAMAALQPGPVRLPGAAHPLSLGDAAYVAGLAACWDEACEGLPRAHGRPGLHAFGPALALGLARGASLGEVLCALVTGFEVAGRLGEMLRIPPGMHVDGTWGSFGAVAAAARLLGLSPGTTGTALLGAACQLPWSLYLPIAEGATARNSYVGEAARRGLSQALAAAAGITAPEAAISTFHRLALGGEGEAPSLATPGQWLIAEGYLKPFAAVRHVHYGAEAACRWRRDAASAPDTRAITALRLEVYGEAIKYCGNRAPATAIQAQFSLSYGLAWALVDGDLGADAYRTESLADPEVRRLEALVELVEAPGWDAAGTRAARLTVSDATGPRTINVEDVPGDRAQPLSAEAVLAKFTRYAGGTLDGGPLLQAPLTTPLVDLL